MADLERCTVSAIETGDLTPLILSALKSDAVREAAAENQIAHPYPAVYRAWKDVDDALTRTLDALENVRMVKDADGSEKALLACFRDFQYRTAEFAEAVKRQNDELMGKGAYNAPKFINDELKQQCNWQKHNGVRLGWVGAVSSFFSVHGYQLRHITANGDTELDHAHRKRPSFSFNLEIRRIVAHLYLLGEHAGRKVIEQYGPPPPRNGDEPWPALSRVMRLNPIVFPGERRMRAPKLEIVDGDLKVDLQGGPSIPLGGPLHVGAKFTSDGVTRTIRIAKV